MAAKTIPLLGPVPGDEVTIIVGGSERGEGRTVHPNLLTSSKYTALTFIPLNLYEQFQKRANVYFLTMSLLMYAGEQTCLFVPSIKAWSTAGLLGVMMLFSACVSAWDDIGRHRRDRHINFGQYSLRQTRSGGQPVAWADLKPGDEVQLNEGDECPADLLVRETSMPGGGFYVSTRNLDGETTLKPKRSLFVGQAMPGFLKAAITAGTPNADIYVMEGKVAYGDNKETPFTMDNICLRGCRVRNTTWIRGVIIFAGKDTRVHQNSRNVPCKIATLETAINQVIWYSVALQLLLTLGTIIGMIAFEASQQLAYVETSQHKTLCLPEPVAFSLTFFVLYSNLVPISLYATMEVLNLVFTFFVGQDTLLACDGINVEPRAANLSHELGQVAYFFTDKTGTLTQNIMRTRVLHSCGRSVEAGSAEAHQMAKADEAASTFWCLSLCHSATVSQDGRAWVATCPEEEAFLDFCESHGWRFGGKNLSSGGITVLTPRGTKIFRMLAILPFDSTRKCMSVLVREDGAEEAVLLVKGADTALLPLASASSSVERTRAAVVTLSSQGLRSLLLASRQLHAQQAEDWLRRWKEAQCAAQNRKAEFVGRLTAEIERDLHVQGVVAVEDLLQEGVEESVSFLREAGVKIWMLTGDNPLTAEAVATRAGLLHPGTDVHHLLADPERDSSLVRTDRWENDALVVSGTYLKHASLDERDWDGLIRAALCCQVVVACRASPMQKALLVRAVQERTRSSSGGPVVTLAIGDGANDCAMLMEAGVGVGILGREGHQAANASDFAVGAFRSVRGLMCVHGRWNYARCCKVVLFTFWRNAVQVVMMALYTLASGFSGTPLFEDKLRISFNAICTIHILAVGLFEKDVNRSKLMSVAREYDVGLEAQGLSVSTTIITMGHAVCTGALTYAVVRLAYPMLAWEGVSDYMTVNLLSYTYLLIACAIRCAAVTTSWDAAMVCAHATSWLLYLAYVVYYCWGGEAAGVATTLLRSPAAWLLTVTTVSLLVSVEWCTFVLQQWGTAVATEVVEEQGDAEESANKGSSSWLASGASESYDRLAQSDDEDLEGCTTARCSEHVREVKLQRQPVWRWKESQVSTGAAGCCAAFCLLICCLIFSLGSSITVSETYCPENGVCVRTLSLPWPRSADRMLVGVGVDGVYQNLNPLVHNQSFWGSNAFGDTFAFRRGKEVCDFAHDENISQQQWRRPAAFSNILHPIGSVECGDDAATTVLVTISRDQNASLAEATAGNAAWKLFLCGGMCSSSGGLQILLWLATAATSATVAAYLWTVRFTFLA